MLIFKQMMRVILGVFFVLGGVNHFRSPKFYVQIMPPYLPWHLELVYISGVFEVLLGVLVMIPRTSHIGGWGLIALLIAIFPANLHMALHTDLYPSIPAYALWLRLPLQLLPMAWAYWMTRPEV